MLKVSLRNLVLGNLCCGNILLKWHGTTRIDSETAIVKEKLNQILKLDGWLLLSLLTYANRPSAKYIISSLERFWSCTQTNVSHHAFTTQCNIRVYFLIETFACGEHQHDECYDLGLLAQDDNNGGEVIENVFANAVSGIHSHTWWPGIQTITEWQCKKNPQIIFKAR